MYLSRGVALIFKVLCSQRVNKVQQSLQGSIGHSLRRSSSSQHILSG